MRLGAPFAAEVFAEETDDPAALAKGHRAKGYGAAFCPEISLKDPGHIRAVETAFAAEDVLIAELHGLTSFEEAGNLIDPDSEKRAAWHEHLCERFAQADEVGARCFLEMPGTCDPNSFHMPHPNNLTDECRDMIVERVREVIDAVRPRRTKFALEMMPFIHPSDPDSYVALLKAVDRESFGVHLDPVNILNSPDRCFNNGKLIKECFDKLGGAILSCHVKDVTLLPAAFPLGIEQCRTGTGLVDYRTYLSELNRLPPDTPLLTEPMPGMQEHDYDLARDYITGVAAEMGLSFL
ncbi:MAG: TIM barrel protein [Gammaproteobacteria bacterium]|nr:TIM barrel protein [Gammaproteobacteria bacterium]